MDTSKNAAISWQRPRIGWWVVLFVILGTVFEFGSIYTDDVLPSPHHLGNLLSLVSGIFMALAVLTITRRLGEDRVSRAIMITAASLFIFSKVLSCTVEYPQLHGVAVFGRDGFAHNVLEDYTYTISLVMILFGFIRSALVANKARCNFGLQNEALKREVEQRAEIERALRSSEALYRDLVDKTPDVVWRVDTTGRFTYASASFEEAFGILPDKIIGKHLADVFPPEVAERANATIIQRMCDDSGANRQCFQFEFSGSDGQERIFESLSTPVWDSHGDVVEIQGIMRDITAHIRTKEALAASEQKYRSFVENNPVAIGRSDRQGKYVLVNQAFLDAVGFSREEVIGKGPEIIRDIVHPEDLRESVEDAKQVMKTRDRRLTEVRVLDGERRWRWYLHLAYPWYESDGRLGGVEAFARDITEQKLAGEAVRKSEQMARALLNATSDLVALVDREGKILAVNEHFASLFGETPAALEGQNILELMDGEVVEERRKKGLTVLETGRPIRFSDEREGRHYEHCFYPVGNEQGAFTQLALYSRDVTESMRKEEERIRLAIAIE
ncbi:MAG: PAS domain S-box protein, partial [Candidatus Hydrogenedentes bacterium]|nr:PAS domain S-box protein [Candidatus Hydrogenedentota bacterium]